jgi:hypothetical protein
MATGDDQDESEIVVHKPGFEILIGSMAGLAAVALIQLISVDELDTPLFISVFCLAVGLPFTATALYVAQVHRADPKYVRPGLILGTVVGCLGFVGLYAIWGGFVAMFWHFCWWAGLTFIACSAVGLGLVNAINWPVDQNLEHEDEEEEQSED